MPPLVGKFFQCACEESAPSFANHSEVYKCENVCVMSFFFALSRFVSKFISLLVHFFFGFCLLGFGATSTRECRLRGRIHHPDTVAGLALEGLKGGDKRIGNSDPFRYSRHPLRLNALKATFYLFRLGLVNLNLVTNVLGST